MAAVLHDSDKLWILFVEAAGLEPLLTSILLSVISHLPWVNTDLFKQAITSMASPLFTLLLTGMFGYVKGCLISLCLYRVSPRVDTLCTAGACLASNVKPGSLWNLTKASSGRGWKFTLIWRLQSFLLGHTGVGQRHQKPPFFLQPRSCMMNSKSVKVSGSQLCFSSLDVWSRFSGYIKNRSSALPSVVTILFIQTTYPHMRCAATFIFIFPLNGANLPQQTGAEWKDF